MQVSLKLLSTKHDDRPLRTESVIGILPRQPKVGERLMILAEPLEEGDVRTILTSPISSLVIQNERLLLIETLNSTYELRFL